MSKSNFTNFPNLLPDFAYFFHFKFHGLVYKLIVRLYCRTEAFPFLFRWRRCFVFSVFDFGNRKKIAWTNSPKPKLWKNKQWLVYKKPRCIHLGESNAICFRDNFYFNFTNNCDVFQESFAEYLFSKYDVPSGCIPQHWYHRSIHQWTDRENFQTNMYLRILSTANVTVSYVQCLCHLVYACYIGSWCLKGTLI